MNSREKLMWNKYQFFKAGISPNDFWKCNISDIDDIMEIDKAIKDKQAREQSIRDAIAQLK